MDTYLSERFEMSGLTVREVLNIDEAIGKQIKTTDDFFVHVETGDGFTKINIKDVLITVEDIIRDCGLYLCCKASYGYSFAISPDDLKQFEEIA